MIHKNFHFFKAVEKVLNTQLLNNNFSHLGVGCGDGGFESMLMSDYPDSSHIGVERITEMWNG
jgi:tRNA G46 methylase TrmB